MKQKLFKAMVSLFLSVLLGFFCGYLVYSTYTNETEYLLGENVIYLLEYQKYDNYNSMKLENLNNDYTYYKDDNNYFIIIGFTKDKKNIKKISSLFDKINITRCYVNDVEFNKILKDYDKELNNTDNSDEIRNILNKMIDYYNTNNVEILKIYN